MALPVTIADVLVWRGDSFTLPIRVWSDALQTQPVDLTGFGSAFTAQARTSTTSPSAVALSVDSSNAASGELIVSLTPSQTADLVGPYGFDVQVANSDATSVTTFVTGRLVVAGDYTRSQ